MDGDTTARERAPDEEPDDRRTAADDRQQPLEPERDVGDHRPGTDQNERAEYRPPPRAVPHGSGCDAQAVNSHPTPVFFRPALVSSPMAHVQVHDDSLAVESPVLVEGLPGVGLVGKIATDHLVDALDMAHYATCHCDGLPDVAVYHEDETEVLGPVRIYADPDTDLLALQSDVPVSPADAADFSTCLTRWLDERDATALYLSGLPTQEKDSPPALHGVATNGATPILEEYDIPQPGQGGLISGPTGALLSRASVEGLDALGLVVQSNPQFPDPEAARTLVLDAVGPIAGVEVDTSKLVEQAEEIADAREQLAKRMSQATDESSQAQPIGFQ